MMIYPLFPGGLERALTFSYDDALDEDIRLAGIFSDHGLKCTFNFCADNGPHDGTFPSFDVNEIYESFRDQEFITLAETITDLINLVNDLRDILENDNR